jgi:hypothetical protein
MLKAVYEGDLGDRHQLRVLIDSPGKILQLDLPAPRPDDSHIHPALLQLLIEIKRSFEVQRIGDNVSFPRLVQAKPRNDEVFARGRTVNEGDLVNRRVIISAKLCCRTAIDAGEVSPGCVTTP